MSTHDTRKPPTRPAHQVLEKPEFVPKTFVPTKAAEKATPRYLQPVAFKIKGSKVLEDAKKPIEIKDFKAKTKSVVGKAPSIPVALNRQVWMWVSRGCEGICGCVFGGCRGL